MAMQVGPSVGSLDLGRPAPTSRDAASGHNLLKELERDQLALAKMLVRLEQLQARLGPDKELESFADGNQGAHARTAAREASKGFGGSPDPNDVDDISDPHRPRRSGGGKGRAAPKAASAVGGGGGGGGMAPAGGGGSFDPIKANAAGGGAGDSPLGGRLDPQLAALFNAVKSGGCFEDVLFGAMCALIKDMQKKIMAKIQELKATTNSTGTSGSGGATGAGGADGGGGAGGGGSGGLDSRDIGMEELKYMMQQLSQMQQAMSNTLNTMHELSMNAVRNIKA